MRGGPKAVSRPHSQQGCRRSSKASAAASSRSSRHDRGFGCCRQRRVAGSRSACCRGANLGPMAATTRSCFGSVGCCPACERHPVVAWSACRSGAWTRRSGGGLAVSRVASRRRLGALGWRQAGCRRAAGWTGSGGSCSGSCSVAASRRASALGEGLAASRNSAPVEGSAAGRMGLDSRWAAGLGSRSAAGLASKARRWAWAMVRCRKKAQSRAWVAGPRRPAQRALRTRGTQGPRANALSSWEVAPLGRARAQATRIPNFSVST